MAKVHRQGDLDTAGNVPVQYSPTVKVEGKSVHRDGDLDNAANRAISSRTVRVNGKPIVTTDDFDNAGHKKIQGASRTSVN